MALAYDNTASTTGGGGGQPYSASHTIAASGNDRILVAVFFGYAGSNAATKFTSVQYNGTAPTGQITPDGEQDRFSNFGSISIYYWLEADLPANGSPTAYNVTATSATGQFNGGLATISFTGAAQETPEADNRNGALDATSSSVSITTATADAAIVDAVAIWTSSISGVSPTAGQSEVQDIGPTTTTRLGLGYEIVGSAGAYSQTWSWTPTSNFDIEFAIAIAPSGAAGISYVDSTTSTSTGNTLTLTVPSGVSNGDLLVAVAMINDNDPDVTWSTPPSGWTLYVPELSTPSTVSTPSCAVWYRIANSEPASYDWVASASGAGLMGSMLAYSGVNTAAPFDVSYTTATGTGGVANPPSTTTLTDGAFVMAIGFQDDDTGFTSLSSGYDEREQVTLASSGNGASLGICDVEKASAGAEDPGGFSSSDAEEWGAITLVLRPIGDGFAPVGIETGNVAQGTAGGTTAHTLTTSSNRAVLVLVDDESTTQATGVTYNGVAMTLVASSTATTGAGNASSMWMILEADLPVGGASYNVSVSGLDAGASVSVIELNNVAQVIPSGSAVDTTETGAVLTSTATVTAPEGKSLSVGCLGQGAYAAVTLNSPPTGTGTWTRLFTIGDPPSSAELGCGYQRWTTSGSKSYTETASGGPNWFRASQIHAVFAAYAPVSVLNNAVFFGCFF